MSSQALPGMAPVVGPGRHSVLGTACLGLAVIAGASFGRDLVLRRTAADLLSASGLATEPANVESLALCERADLAAAFVAESVLAEQAPAGASSGASARFGARAGKLLERARDMAAVAVSERPGWAPHQLLLGRAGYAVWDLSARPEASATRAWFQAFQTAGSEAPGLDLTWVTAADAVVAAWPRLSASDREEAIPVLRRAFLSAAYVGQAFPGVWRVLGPRAVELLPEAADNLREGVAAFRAMGQPAAAQALEARLHRVAAPPAE